MWCRILQKKKETYKNTSEQLYGYNSLLLHLKVVLDREMESNRDIKVIIIYYLL